MSTDQSDDEADDKIVILEVTTFEEGHRLQKIINDWMESMLQASMSIIESKFVNGVVGHLEASLKLSFPGEDNENLHLIMMSDCFIKALRKFLCKSMGTWADRFYRCNVASIKPLLEQDHVEIFTIVKDKIVRRVDNTTYSLYKNMGVIRPENSRVINERLSEDEHRRFAEEFIQKFDYFKATTAKLVDNVRMKERQKQEVQAAKARELQGEEPDSAIPDLTKLPNSTEIVSEQDQLLSKVIGFENDAIASIIVDKMQLEKRPDGVIAPYFSKPVNDGKRRAKSILDAVKDPMESIFTINQMGRKVYSQSKHQYLYLILAYSLSCVKIGVTAGSAADLRKRYSTTYGSNIKIIHLDLYDQKSQYPELVRYSRERIVLYMLAPFGVSGCKEVFHAGGSYANRIPNNTMIKNLTDGKVDGSNISCQWYYCFLYFSALQYVQTQFTEAACCQFIRVLDAKNWSLAVGLSYAILKHLESLILVPPTKPPRDLKDHFQQYYSNEKCIGLQESDFCLGDGMPTIKAVIAKYLNLGEEVITPYGHGDNENKMDDDDESSYESFAEESVSNSDEDIVHGNSSRKRKIDSDDEQPDDNNLMESIFGSDSGSDNDGDDNHNDNESKSAVKKTANSADVEEQQKLETVFKVPQYQTNSSEPDSSEAPEVPEGLINEILLDSSLGQTIGAYSSEGIAEHEDDLAMIDAVLTVETNLAESGAAKTVENNNSESMNDRSTSSSTILNTAEIEVPGDKPLDNLTGQADVGKQHVNTTTDELSPSAEVASNSNKRMLTTAEIDSWLQLQLRDSIPDDTIVLSSIFCSDVNVAARKTRPKNSSPQSVVAYPVNRKAALSYHMKILLPCCEKNHFFLLCYWRKSISDANIFYLDSLYQDGEFQSRFDYGRNLLLELFTIEEQVDLCRQTPSEATRLKCQQQEKTSLDCGVYMIAYIKELLKSIKGNHLPIVPPAILTPEAVVQLRNEIVDAQQRMNKLPVQHRKKKSKNTVKEISTSGVSTVGIKKSDGSQLANLVAVNFDIAGLSESWRVYIESLNNSKGSPIPLLAENSETDPYYSHGFDGLYTKTTSRVQEPVYTNGFQPTTVLEGTCHSVFFKLEYFYCSNKKHSLRLYVQNQNKWVLMTHFVEVEEGAVHLELNFCIVKRLANKKWYNYIYCLLMLCLRSWAKRFPRSYGGIQLKVHRWNNHHSDVQLKTFLSHYSKKYRIMSEDTYILDFNAFLV